MSRVRSETSRSPSLLTALALGSCTTTPVGVVPRGTTPIAVASEASAHAEPAAAARFCFESTLYEPPQPIKCGINGPECRELPADTPMETTGPRGPYTEESFCKEALRALDALWADDEELSCGPPSFLLPDVALFEASQGGDLTRLLAQQRADGWHLLAVMGSGFEGRGYMSSWIDGKAAFERNAVISVYMRERQTDWDVGVMAYSENEWCNRASCTRQTSGVVECSPVAQLRKHGGNYRVIETAPNPHNWPYEVGEPEMQWDCRAEELVGAATAIGTTR